VKNPQLSPSSEHALTTLARLATDAGRARPLADALADAFGEAAVAAFQGADGTWAVEVHFAQHPDISAVRDAIAKVAGAAAARAMTFETIAPRDWVAASLAGLKPVSAGRFVVHGAHDRERARDTARIAIEIEAALAFGTGHHGTTLGCLLALDALLKRAPHLAAGRQRILDIGTGTGVLAIAAAKALRVHVVASDIDRRAVEVARGNARTNHVGALIEVVHAAGVTGERLRRRGPFDLVLANILLPPLKRLAAPMARLLAPGAHVILSGLLASQANAALAAYRAQGLALETRIPLDEWETLVLRRGKRT
jgi:ribosomal protein L11 methyltransferase